MRQKKSIYHHIRIAVGVRRWVVCEKVGGALLYHLYRDLGCMMRGYRISTGRIAQIYWNGGSIRPVVLRIWFTSFTPLTHMRHHARGDHDRLGKGFEIGMLVASRSRAMIRGHGQNVAATGAVQSD